MSSRVAIVGGGAAGFFAAITCGERNPEAEITIFEKTAKVLEKVRISGGGRCNVTHACFDPRELTRNYPRGERELIGPYHRFQAEDTVGWFEQRGIRLKTESDGRMFPVTDSSQTIIDCLVEQATRAHVTIRTNCAVNAVSKQGDVFRLDLATGDSFTCDRLLLASGGCRTPALGQLAVSLGHTLVPPVPSLFTFHIEAPWIRELAGVTVPDVELSIAETKLKAKGPLLFTHWGLSGPAVLRLSAWGARILHDKNYQFALSVKWSGLQTGDLNSYAQSHGAKLVMNAPLAPLSQRIWQALLNLASIPRDRRWSSLTRAEHQRLLEALSNTTLPVTGKSLNKDEFVTCGGVELNEVNFKTMESKICPGLYFGGELLDIDGLTGGFNFQAAWTTGWIAGNSMADRE
jgi:predicted Rossmann fold flavoprotein